ncbi:MAG: excinuclease ABC subunit B [Candidatus Cloacimonadota bacterium]|nr:MAG: excinuclease ABC subunit B [Candidatus Cloacimonadota bacterium]
MFKVVSEFEPQGDQISAIADLSSSLENKNKHQILKGVTGSGKTYVMAKTIEKLNRPTLVLTHNKTLVGQLYQEFKSFFPNNAVEYFVSYYDYYQPEAYLPSRDVFIEKDSQINEEIDYLRHRATGSVFQREDVIIVASVSCIYGLGSPDLYLKMSVSLKCGEEVDRDTILKQLVSIQYTRAAYLTRGTFRVRGDVVEVFPKTSESAIRVEFFGDDVEKIMEFDPLTGVVFNELKEVNLYPAQHYVTPKNVIGDALLRIRKELKEQELKFAKNGQLIEAQRIRERTSFDLEMISEIGFCSGIENYSRHLEGRKEGDPPTTLLDYLPHNALIFLDESHATLPQLKGMYNGDRARKQNLVDYGFRLPSALDNRPLQYEEFDKIDRQVIYVSATPGPIELQNASNNLIPLIIRPTGLLDPEIIIKPIEFQVDDVIKECKIRVEKNERVFVTTLTKKMSEDLSEYMVDQGVNAKYLHSEIKTIERQEIIRDLRLGKFDVLIGINLLREGLDVPEVSLVCVLDADKEGFLRSSTALIQISGRAARNVNGQVIYYADKMTDAIKFSIQEANTRRSIQKEYNRVNNIIPKTIYKTIYDSIRDEIPVEEEAEQAIEAVKQIKNLSEKEKLSEIKNLSKLMHKSSEELNFELAARLRDEIYVLQNKS